MRSGEENELSQNAANTASHTWPHTGYGGRGAGELTSHKWYLAQRRGKEEV